MLPATTRTGGDVMQPATKRPGVLCIICAAGSGVMRFAALGLCLAGTFTLSAVAASSASAATAEYGECVSHAKGNYTNSNCTTKSKPKKGDFEWIHGPGECYAMKHGEYTNSSCTAKSKKKKKGHFEVSPASYDNWTSYDPAPVVLEALEPFDIVITCSEGSHMLGELTSGKTIHDNFIQLYGCSGSEAGKASYSCQGPGMDEEPGDLISGPLNGSLEVEEPSGELVTKLTGEDGYMFEMVCHNPAAPGELQKLRFAGSTTDANAGDLVDQMGLVEYNDFEDAAFGSGLTSGYNDDNLGWHEGYGRAYFSGQTKSEFLFEIEIRE
jgi:hypothetical protein